jgi:hypothetical protein
LLSAATGWNDLPHHVEHHVALVSLGSTSFRFGRVNPSAACQETGGVLLLAVPVVEPGGIRMLLGCGLSEVFMIGKVVRMLVGRSMARSRGYSGVAGAAIALVAPVLVKHAGKAVAKRVAARRRAKEEREAPKFAGPIARTDNQIGKNS